MQIPEEVELVWDDNVAPETAIDIESQHISARQVFGTWGVVLALFGGLIAFCNFVDPEKNSPVAKRHHVIPFDGLRKEHGLMVDDE